MAVTACLLASCWDALLLLCCILRCPKCPSLCLPSPSALALRRLHALLAPSLFRPQALSIGNLLLARVLGELLEKAAQA